MNKKSFITVALVLGVLVTSISLAHAAVVGHWRFEDDPGFLADSSGNDFTLASANGYVMQYTLPASGEGQFFDDPIPLTGQGNAKAALFDGSDWLTLADQPEFSLNTFTVEAYIHRNAQSTRHVIASQWDSVDNQRGWGFLVMEDNSLSMFLSPDGADFGGVNHQAGIRIRSGVDYYVAASYDPEDLGAGMKFYAKNLETGIWSQSSSALHFEPPMHDSSANLNIGGYANGARLFEGMIDEVRISDTVLSGSELLAGPVDTSPTIAHWRFENDPGFLADSSGNGFTLSNNGATPYALPASGNGQFFDDPIPQTGVSNAQAGDFDAAGWLGHADAPEFSVNGFTIEAYIHRDSLGSRHVIASQYDGVDNQRSWAFFVNDTNELLMFLSGNGASISWISSGIQINAGLDYFVAASYNPAGGVNFYVKDLATGTWMESTAGREVNFVHDSTGNLNIGSYANGAQLFDGLIDEVRWSRVVLSKDELLASLPESTLPGDLNGDGFVGGDDLDIVRSFWGQSVEQGNLLEGDPSNDGFVGGDDLDIVRANWGQGSPPSPGVVPEPSALVLLMGGMLGGLFLLRRNGV